MAIHFNCGDKEEAIDIMREAAEWLNNIGQPMWELNDLTSEKLDNPAENFIILWNDLKSVAAMILNFEDNFFWPSITPGTSGFIHKLSVRREYASKGYAKMMVEHAKTICKSKNIPHLRLDCDANRNGLMQFYLTCGFKLFETKSIHTKKLGKLDFALFEMNI